MKKLTNFIRSLSKKSKIAIVSVMALTAVAVPAVVFAGYGPNGPERKIYDFSNPAEREGAFDGPRFNSYINTNVYGDERAFLDAKECVVDGPQCYTSGTAGGYKDQQPVQVGKEYLIRTYVHNIANPSINASGKGVARDTKVQIEIPEGVANGFTLQSVISASNSLPKEVYDTVDLRNGNSAFDVEYVPGSAYIFNRAHKDGYKLGDDIVKDGAKIGYNEMNGNVPGCFEYSAFVTIRVKIKAPKLEVKKQVTTPGATTWHESIKAKKGDTVSWLINYDVKDHVAENVVVRDVMPKGVTLVPGSIMLFVPTNPEGIKLNDTALGAGGVDVGDYHAGSGGAIRFRTTVDQDIEEKDPDCKVRNVAFARAENVPEVDDDAEVVVEDCNPPVVTPVYACDALSVSKVSKFEYKFDAKATAKDGASIVSYTYDFGDNTTPLTTDKATVNYTYAKTGEYATKVTVNVNVNGETKSVTSDNCMVTINIPENPTENCPIPGKEHLPKDSKECVEKPSNPPKGPKSLPDTGMGAVAGIFGAVTAVGTAAHAVIGRRR